MERDVSIILVTQQELVNTSDSALEPSEQHAFLWDAVCRCNCIKEILPCDTL